ncbi:alpha/beta fold hydrolase [Nonomuraea jabiensis]|uniref:alpha/beta fold hydrolase n=1 Tax=Nonomuraea jabiensis TaxID=882448 RepID=UPI003D758EC6
MGGAALLERAMDGDLTAGVRQRPVNVAAGRSLTVWVRWAEELHRLIPASRLLILERSGHLGHLEEPERFAAEVAALVSAPRA